MLLQRSADPATTPGGTYYGRRWVGLV